MKKYLFTLLTSTLILTTNIAPTLATDNSNPIITKTKSSIVNHISTEVDKPVLKIIKSINKNGSTYISLNDLSHLLGIEVSYDDSKKEIVIDNILTIKDNKATILEMTKYLDIINIDGITYLPFRDTLSFLGYSINYNNKTKYINITGREFYGLNYINDIAMAHSITDISTKDGKTTITIPKELDTSNYNTIPRTESPKYLLFSVPEEFDTEEHTEDFQEEELINSPAGSYKTLKIETIEKLDGEVRVTGTLVDTLEILQEYNTKIPNSLDIRVALSNYKN